MPEKKIPTVRIGEHRIPAHRLWKVVESITTAADLVEKFNETRAQLSTPMTRDVVLTVRTRIRDMDLAMGGEGAMQAAAAAAGLDVAPPDAAAAGTGGQGDNEIDAAKGGRGSTEVAEPGKDDRLLSDADLAEAARQLLGAMSVEEALHMLQTDYDNPIDIRGLIAMVGEEVYLETLSREAGEFIANMIAADQIVELWNESGLPSPIGGLWTVADVEKLLP